MATAELFSGTWPQLLLAAAFVITFFLIVRYARHTARSKAGCVLEPGGEEAPIQKTADKISRGILIFAVCAAALVFAVRFVLSGDIGTALLNAAAVFISALPCVFGFAAEISVMAGIRKIAENGMLIKSGKKLEALSEITTAVFGKTGIITSLAPQVTDVVAMPRFFEEEIIAFAAAAGKNSAHPLFRAIYEYAQPTVITGLVEEKTVRAGEHDIVSIHSESHGFIGSVPDAEAVEIVEGRGVMALVGGREVLVGTRGFLEEHGVDIRLFEPVASKLESAGKTAMLVAINKKAAGIMAAGETVRASARKAICGLGDMGVKVFMITEDSECTAASIAEDAGIHHVLAGILPQDKARAIESLKNSGASVAVIGGAIDAPALLAADAAISAGLGMPDNTAGIVLTNDDLNAIPEAIRLSRAAIRKIKRSFIFAFVFGGTEMLLAAAGLLPPLLVCGIAAVLSGLILAGSIYSHLGR